MLDVPYNLPILYIYIYIVISYTMFIHCIYHLILILKIMMHSRVLLDIGIIW